MAVTPNTDEAFLREVDEELRREQVVDVWKNYGRWIIAAIVLALVVFASVLGWRYWNHREAETQAVKLQSAYDALGAGKVSDAKAPLADLDASGAPGYRAAAKMIEGNQLLQAGKTKEALAKYNEVASDTAVGKPLRDLALIRQTSIEFDTLAPQTIVDRLSPLATKGAAWLGSAGEMVALADLRLNKPEAARAMFKTIAEDENVPDSIRQRAVQGVDTVDVGTNDQKDK